MCLSNIPHIYSCLPKLLFSEKGIFKLLDYNCSLIFSHTVLPSSNYKFKRILVNTYILIIIFIFLMNYLFNLLILNLVVY